MKKTLQAIAGIFIVLITYITYVLYNLLCIFGVGTKLPFKDFLVNSYARKLAYVRITVALFVYSLWKLIF